MIIVNGKDIKMIQVRYDGHSHKILTDDLDIVGAVDTVALFNAIENNLGLSAGVLNGYELAELSNVLTIHPQTKFGD